MKRCNKSYRSSSKKEQQKSRQISAAISSETQRIEICLL
jgi:hypothetical protein